MNIYFKGSVATLLILSVWIYFVSTLNVY